MNLEELRNAHGLTRAEASRKAGIGVSTWAAAERGARKLSFESAAAIAAAFNVLALTDESALGWAFTTRGAYLGAHRLSAEQMRGDWG